MPEVVSLGKLGRLGKSTPGMGLGLESWHWGCGQRSSCSRAICPVPWPCRVNGEEGKGGLRGLGCKGVEELWGGFGGGHSLLMHTWLEAIDAWIEGEGI